MQRCTLGVREGRESYVHVHFGLDKTQKKESQRSPKVVCRLADHEGDSAELSNVIKLSNHFGATSLSSSVSWTSCTLFNVASKLHSVSTFTVLDITDNTTNRCILLTGRDYWGFFLVGKMHIMPYVYCWVYTLIPDYGNYSFQIMINDKWFLKLNHYCTLVETSVDHEEYKTTMWFRCWTFPVLPEVLLLCCVAQDSWLATWLLYGTWRYLCSVDCNRLLWASRINVWMYVN